jgi:hypothetical protein
MKADQLAVNVYPEKMEANAKEIKYVAVQARTVLYEELRKDGRSGRDSWRSQNASV